jgi:hypothetical protein
MDVVVMAYTIVGAAVVAGGILIARVVWRRLGFDKRRFVERARRDRRQHTVPVAWDRRVWPRRLDDLTKGFVAGSDDATPYRVR